MSEDVFESEGWMAVIVVKLKAGEDGYTIDAEGDGDA